MIGSPTHLRLKKLSTACGLVGVKYETYDPRHVDCIRCKKTKRYKSVVHGEKEQ